LDQKKFIIRFSKSNIDLDCVYEIKLNENTEIIVAFLEKILIMKKLLRTTTNIIDIVGKIEYFWMKDF